MFLSLEQEKILNKVVYHLLLKRFATHLVQNCTHSHDEISWEEGHGAYCARCQTKTVKDELTR